MMLFYNREMSFLVFFFLKIRCLKCVHILLFKKRNSDFLDEIPCFPTKFIYSFIKTKINEY
jgi:hypothetical protein